MAIVQIINRSGGTSDTGGGGGSATLKIENLSSQVTGSNINFSTSSQFVEDTIQVYTMVCYRYKAGRMTIQRTVIGAVLLLRLLLRQVQK